MKASDRPAEPAPIATRWSPSAGPFVRANEIDPRPGRPASFGVTLRERRVGRGLGLRHLSRMIGLSASYLSLIEHDLVPPPSARIMNRLAKALNVDVEELLAAAGIIPERVLAIIRERPVAIERLMTLVAPMADEEVDELCDELRRRLRSRLSLGGAIRQYDR